MNLYQLPSGKWRVEVMVNRQRRRATMPTKAAAKMRGAELTIELGGTATATDVTVVELLAAHLEQHDYAATTADDARRVIDRLPEPFLSRRLRDVTPAVLSGLYRELLRAGLTPWRVRRVHMVLSSAFTRARRYGWVTVNPARDADVPRTAESTIHPPSEADVARLLDAAGDRLAVFLLLAATTGARRGELVALQWRDVDLDAGSIVVRRSLSYTPASGVIVGETKTGRRGHRVVAVGPSVVAALREHRRLEREIAMRVGLRGDRGWIFSHDGGVTPWRPDYGTRRFGQLRDELAIACRLHDLRHAVATTMLANGASAAQVAGRLGHANPATTLRVYAHFIPAHDREHAERLERGLGRSGTL